MKRGGFAVCMVLCLICSAAADTTWVSGGSVGGHWNAAGSPYMILGNVTLEDAGLIIDPGVRIYFTGPYSFTCQLWGELKARGTAQDSIYLTTDTLANPGRWRGLRFDFFIDGVCSLRYCVIENSWATGGQYLDDGGGVYITADPPLFFDHCSIRNNIATGRGGGVYNELSSSRFDHCVIAGNRALLWAGAVYGTVSSGMEFVNCTIADNTSADVAVYLEFARATFNSCVMAFSSGGGLYAATPASWAPVIRHCNFFGNVTGSFDGTLPAGLGVLSAVNVNGDSCDVFGNVFADPAFVNHAAGDYHLTAASACVNAGDSTLPLDADGTPADIGTFALYRPAGPTVVNSADVGGRWSVWGSPYTVLCNAIVAGGNLLQIGPGVVVQVIGPYSITVNGRLCVAGTPQQPVRFTTDTLSAANRWKGLRFVNADSGCRLSYAIVEYGWARDASPGDRGGGVYCYSSSPRFYGCTFRRNEAEYGGGLASLQSSPVLMRCDFLNNLAHRYGGGLYAAGGTITVDSCRVDSNTAVYRGGGLCFHACEGDVQHSVVIRNSVLSTFAFGGGVWCDSSTGSITHCTLVLNSASRSGSHGGGLVLWSSFMDVNSSLIAFSAGSGVFFYASRQSALSFCDVFGNVPAALDGDVPPGLGILSRVNVNGDSCDAAANLRSDPLLAEAASGDVSLMTGSPCIHGGDPALPLDADGTTGDIGAFFHFQPYVPPSPFALRAPQEGDSVELDSSLTFRWQTSVDGDRGDRVDYRLCIQWGDSQRTLACTETSLVVDFAQLPLTGGSVLEWWVTAHSPRPDTTVESESRFHLNLKPSDVSPGQASLPERFAFHGNCPNPFNAVTELRFDLPQPARVRCVVCDVLGRVVAQLADSRFEAGNHRLMFDASRLSSGLYFARLQAGPLVATAKMVLVK